MTKGELDILEFCIKNGEHLDRPKREFIQKVRWMVDKGKELSSQQSQYLQDCYSRITSSIYGIEGTTKDE